MCNVTLLWCRCYVLAQNDTPKWWFMYRRLHIEPILCAFGQRTVVTLRGEAAIVAS